MSKIKKIGLSVLFAAAVLFATAAIMPVATKASAANIAEGVQVTLTDGIVVKVYKTLDESVTEATATFESAVEALSSTVNGTKENGVWKFVYEKVTPQYLDATFTVKVNGEDEVTDYSVEKYLNAIVSGEYAEKEKAVAKDLLYYGQAAKAYKLDGEVTTEPATTFAGSDGMTLTGEYEDTNRIAGATAVFDTLPALRVTFKKASEDATVTVDGKDVTSALVKIAENTYTYTVSGIYATEFGKRYEVTLVNGEKTQTLKYSLNDYAARLGEKGSAKMQTLAKALWCYGYSANALLAYQNKYEVVTAPTYTEEGFARNGKGEEVKLPVLNNRNYAFTQTAFDGGEYKYNSANGGKAYFTHVATGIVIEKEITADTITFNWTDYNNVDINFKVAQKHSGKMTGAYVDGVYVLTLLNGSEVSIPNFTKLSSVSPEVKITGNGSLTIDKTTQMTNVSTLTVDGATFVQNTGVTTSALTIENGGSVTLPDTSKLTGKISVNGGTLTAGSVTSGDFEITNGATVDISGVITISQNGKMLLDKNSTLTATASNDTLVVETTGVAELYGKATFTSDTENTYTAISLYGGASLIIDRSSRLTANDYAYSLSTWSGDGNGKFYFPENTTISSAKYSIDDDCLFEFSTCKSGGWFNRVDKLYTYTLVSTPTISETGVAKHVSGKEVVLPALGSAEYYNTLTASKITVVHRYTGVTVATVDLTEAENVIGDLTVNYSAEAGYMFTVADGKAVELSGNFVSTAATLTVAGKGALTINGQVSVKNLTVESDATFNVIATEKKDVVVINDGGTIKLFGTTEIRGFAIGTTGICFQKATSTMYISETSRVKITGTYDYPIGQFNDQNNSIKAYYPANGTYANNKITDADENVLFEYETGTKGGALRIEFTKQEA